MWADYVQPRKLHTVVLRCLDGPASSPSHSLTKFMEAFPSKTTPFLAAVTQLWKELVGAAA